VTACSGVGGASWPAPPVERLRPVPKGVAETPEQPSSPHELQAPGPSKRPEAAQSQIEAAAPDSGLLQGAREAKTEPQIGPVWTALDPSHASEQPPVASEPAPFPAAVACDSPSHEPPTSGPLPGHGADCGPPQALPWMAVLTPSESSPNRAIRMPEQRLQRLPRIKVALQALAKAPAAVSGLPPRPEPDPTVTDVSETGTGQPLPLEKNPASTPSRQSAPPFQRAKLELRSPVPAPAAGPAGGLTIHRLEVQIVERPRTEVIQPSPAPIAPAGSAWDLPDRRHQGHVF
jgi:hypothetical protein